MELVGNFAKSFSIKRRNMLARLVPTINVQVKRKFATKIKKSVILQDKDKLPGTLYVHSY